MKIKKLLASVTAAALTATSLAVVNVSAADKTATYSFIYDTNYLTFTYTNDLYARSGINLEDLFGEGETLTEKEYSFDLKAEIDPSGVKGYQDWMHWALERISYVGNMRIEIKGKNKETDNIETVYCLAQNKDGHKWFRVLGDASSEKFIYPDKGDLDVSRFKVITDVKITQDLKTDYIGNYTITENTLKYKLHGEAVGSTDASGINDLFAKVVETKSYKNNQVYNVGGQYLEFDKAYAFEDAKVDLSGDAGYKPVTEKEDGSVVSLLKWANDNIGYSVGTKIKLVFAASDSAGGGDDIGWFGSHPTDTGTDPWYVSDAASSSAQAFDAVMVVNGRSSNQLRQEVVMTKVGNDYVAEFDWDTIMAASPTTVTGHVTSIAFALNGGALAKGNHVVGDNYYNIVNKDGTATLKQIDIVVPEGQSSLPTDDNKGGDAANNDTERQQLKSVDSNTGAGVRVVSTNSALNGGTIEFTYDISANGFFYNIKLIDANGISIQPKGDLTIELYIPKTLQGRTLKVTELDHISADGTKSKDAILNLDTYKTDNFLKIKVNKLSNIGGSDLFEEEPEVTEPEATQPEATEAPTTSDDVAGNVGGQTGDKTTPATGFAIAIVPAALAAAAAVVAKKRK